LKFVEGGLPTGGREGFDGCCEFCGGGSVAFEFAEGKIEGIGGFCILTGTEGVSFFVSSLINFRLT
jgi:hypothetical protein